MGFENSDSVEAVKAVGPSVMLRLKFPDGSLGCMACTKTVLFLLQQDLGSLSVSRFRHY
ncbi:hypothetical protein F3Y22_tig00110744pilonHSYRG00028 [Hibiscus syriacus]|uniref:Uncharacterized protein n=1 Tax=Hibiscus syriacus TaxID=106335 RepID=A0A6A2ZUI2_HIBSY|nr:hypothetical protein F3Y22_tig00110744pilonHSYRG00028 [Hibiscus syriacus]